MFSKKDLINLEGLFMLYAVKTSDGKVMAAKNMSTSIDTLNKYLEILERELGMRLISVADRRCVLTGNGEKVFVIAEQIIDCLRKAYDLRNNENAVKGEVRIACDRTVKYNFCQCELEHFLDQYTDISLSIDTYDSITEFESRNYDLGLSYDQPKNDNLIMLFTKDIPCGFFASCDYLVKHSPPADLDELLQNHRLVLKRDWLAILKSAFERLNRDCRGVCLSNSTLIVSEIVKNGGGIGVLPLSANSNEKGLVCLSNIQCPLTSKAYLFTRKERTDIPRIRAVIDYYKRAFAAL